MSNLGLMTEDERRAYWRAERSKARNWKRIELTPAEYNKWKGKKTWKGRLLMRARRRGRDRGLESTIRTGDLHWPTHCPVLGIELYYPDHVGEVGNIRPDLPTLDRFDNTKGYVPGNVIVISWRANTLKSNATLGEMEKVVAYLKNYDLL